MQRSMKYLRVILLMAIFGLSQPLVARALDICAICGKEIQGTVYIATDEFTGEKKLICSDCIKLPRCSICGLPVIKKNGLELPDGRYFCARDAKTIVVKADEAVRICADVKDDLDRLFSRFTSFPDNVDVSVIDRVDVDSMFDTEGHSFESPDLLGYINTVTNNNQTRHKIHVLTGLPLAELKETCAHEYSHGWVRENVPPERHARIARDAEEGFCELVGYLLMDSQHEEGEKKRVLANHYTRGQINLFLEAEQRYGFDQILDWMKYGVTARLEEGRLDKIRDVQMPSAKTVAVNPVTYKVISNTNKPAPAPTILKLQGIMWGTHPSAIINGHSFFANDVNNINLGGTNVNIRCLAIQPDSVRIQNVDSGKEQELRLPAR